MINKQQELKHNERLIAVSYNNMSELMNRSNFIRERLLLHMDENQYISSEYISQDETKYYLNFILTPKHN